MSLSVERLFNPSLYVKLLGRAGGQTVYGGTASGNDLNLYSTTNPTHGQINLGDVLYVHEDDMQVVIGTTSPYQVSKLFIQHTYTGTGNSYGTFQGLSWSPSGSSSALIGAMGFTAQLDGANAVTGQIKGIEGFVFHNGTASLASALGASYLVKKLNTGDLTAAYGVSATIQNTNASGTISIATPINIGAPTATGPITFAFALNINNQGSANVTAAAGIYLARQTGAASLNYEIYSESANVLFNANNNSGATFAIYGSSDNNLFNVGTTNQSIGIGVANSSSVKLSIDGTTGKVNPLNITREKTATTVNHVGGYASSASTITVSDASGFAVNDKVTIEATVLNAISFTWYEAIFDLTVQSISSNDITFTTTIGKQGCNNGDRVIKQDMTHGKTTQTGATSYFRYQANFQDYVAASINKYETGLAINTSEGYSASGVQLFDENGKQRFWVSHGKLQLTQSTGTGVGINILRGPGGFSVNDSRLLDADTGRLRQLASLAEDGLRIGMPNTDAGADDVFQQSRGGSIQVVGDSSGRDAFRVDHNNMYRITVGSQNLGSATANPSSSITAGATTVNLDASTIEPRYGFTFLGNFTTGATVTITETAKATTTSVITINREAGTLTLTTPAADNYTTAAVITQQKYSPYMRFIRGSDGATTLYFSGEDARIGIGTTSPATSFEIEHTKTLTASPADDYAGTITLDPGYTGAFTVTRHNYIDVQNVSVAASAAVTDAAVMRFDAAAGTHKAVDSGTTKTSIGTPDAWLKYNVNGTIHYVPAYISKTA